MRPGAGFPCGAPTTPSSRRSSARLRSWRALPPHPVPARVLHAPRPAWHIARQLEAAGLASDLPPLERPHANRPAPSWRSRFDGAVARLLARLSVRHGERTLTPPKSTAQRDEPHRCVGVGRPGRPSTRVALAPPAGSTATPAHPSRARSGMHRTSVVAPGALRADRSAQFARHPARRLFVGVYGTILAVPEGFPASSLTTRISMKKGGRV